MYKAMVEILHFVGGMPMFLIAVIGRTMERYAGTRTTVLGNERPDGQKSNFHNFWMEIYIRKDST